MATDQYFRQAYARRNHDEDRPMVIPSLEAGGQSGGYSSEFVNAQPVRRQVRMQMVGSEYGGWAVDVDLIPYGSTVISAGVGEDISFDEGLIDIRGCTVIGIDPTPKARRYVERVAGANFRFIPRALCARSNEKVRLYRNSNPDHVSESVTAGHNSVLKDDYYEADTVGLVDVLNHYQNISVLKMDIEGAEYEVLDSLVSIDVPQICVEFHHVCTDYTIADTMRCVERLRRMGYFAADIRNKAGAYHEVTFVHRKYACEAGQTEFLAGDLYSSANRRV